jgi:hypothetical protein
MLAAHYLSGMVDIAKSAYVILDGWPLSGLVDIAKSADTLSLVWERSSFSFGGYVRLTFTMRIFSPLMGGLMKN